MSRDLHTIELRYLAALIAVHRDASFSRAAERLGYTQSAVSQQIARLERGIGHQLVERPGGSRAVSLTPAGKVLLRHAEAIVARLTSAAADLDALDDGTAGTLRIGCYQSVGVRILPRVMREFLAQFPGVNVQLVENEDDGELLAQVERGELDLSFVVAPLPPGPFDSEELLEDPYVVAVRDDSPLGRGTGTVTPKDLARIPLISYAQIREAHLIENRLGHPALAGQMVFRSNDNGTILGLAAEGVGAAVIPWLSVDPHRDGLRVLQISGVSRRIVGIAWHRDRYQIPAAHAFIDLAHAAANEEEIHMRAALGNGAPRSGTKP
ncbi:LysR family transcriptional regulator, partial [Rhodococcus sp. NPDC057014]|uniref:LysR family transcriptional regulator n=1 Tax=Rhodococcus sp. NPDC057014 TaxID=3346000 RepID=UPI003643F3C4